MENNPFSLGNKDIDEFNFSNNIADNDSLLGPNHPGFETENNPYAKKGNQSNIPESRYSFFEPPPNNININKDKEFRPNHDHIKPTQFE